MWREFSSTKGMFGTTKDNNYPVIQLKLSLSFQTAQLTLSYTPE
jgi:hypothetical protein